MIRQIEIEGFKSIDRLKLKPGRVTVLIGENGCGKSNILEAIAMAGAAAADLLGHEFLGPRGVRVTDSRFMAPVFAERESTRTAVTVTVSDAPPALFVLAPENPEAASDWQHDLLASLPADRAHSLFIDLAEAAPTSPEDVAGILKHYFRESRRERAASEATIRRFLVYSAENSALRQFQSEGQILPLGIRGDGLFSHLRYLRTHAPDMIEQLSERLKLIDWFDGFEVPADLAPGEHRLDIRDRYIDASERFDQRSANEGFLFLLFYFTLLMSPDTPRFFAIDNIDASLNPRLCSRLMSSVVELARAHGKQVIVTTHNPAILDGLNLEDPDQRLLVVERGPEGPTRVHRVKPPRHIEGAPPLRLSEAFIRGHLGGLPDHF